MALVYAGLTIPSAAVLNSVATPRPLAAAGARALVPLVYGQDRVAGLILNVLLSGAGSSTLLVQVLWCHACQSVGTLKLNDRDLVSGATATHYTGSQSTADAALVAAFAAQSITYTDTLAGYAYSVVAMPVNVFDGQLGFSALIQGRKLYDPRLDSTNGGSGTHRLATPSTWAYSANPALALADWLYSSAYGANDPPLWSSVITAANANDALIGSPTETHRVIGLTLSAAAPVPAVAEALRAYAGVWLVPTSGGVKLLPDATASSAATYSHASGHIAAIDALALRDLGNSPTAVEVVYTDARQVPYRSASAFAQRAGAGTTLPWRLSTVALPGIQRYGQAVREATERLNKLTLSDLSTTLEVFDGGIAHEVGDVVTVSHPVGLVSKLFRLNAPPQLVGPGRWRLPLSEYDPAVYSAAVASAPTYSDSGLEMGGSAGPGVNILPNSAFEAGLNGWSLVEASGPTQIIGINYVGSIVWQLLPTDAPWTGVLYIQQATAGTDDAHYFGRGSNPISVKPNTRYILSGYLQIHRASGSFFCRVYNSSGAEIADAQGGATIGHNQQADGYTLDRYERGSSAFTTGSTAAFVRVFIRKSDTNTGADSFLFATRFMLEEATAVSLVSEWTPGPDVPIGGVTTSALVSEAATEVFELQDPTDRTINSGNPNSQLTQTFTSPSVVSELILTATARAKNTTIGTGNAPRLYVDAQWNAGGAVAQSLDYRLQGSNEITLVATMTTTIPANDPTLGVRAVFATDGSGYVTDLYDMRLRVEVVKR